MRIGISCYPTHGGSGIIATELGKHLAAKGHEVAFISFKMPIRLSQIPPRVSFHEVAVEEYPLLRPFPYTLALASRMADVARMKKLQIMHVHYAIPFASAALLARQIVPELQLKIVTTLHGTDVTLVGNNPSFRPVTALAIEDSDAVTAVSKFLKEQTYREFGVKNDIQVIHNFVDTRRHAPVPPCLERYKRSTMGTIMHISNFRAVKRVRDVIRIFARIAGRRNARLLLVGDGPDTGAAFEEAQRLQIADRVEFLGLVDDVIPLFGVADLLLLPSEIESFGLVALEAMASGVPVIGSRVGGLPEVVEDGVNGFLSDVGDIKTMAACALRLLDDSHLFADFCKAARNRAKQYFDCRKVVPRYESVYETVLAGDQGTSC